MQQPGGKHIGFFLGIDHIEIFFEVGQRARGALHLRLQLFQLLFHIARHLRSCLIANVVRMTYVAAGNFVDHVGGELRIRRPVTDQKEKGMQWTT